MNHNIYNELCGNCGERLGMHGSSACPKPGGTFVPTDVYLYADSYDVRSRNGLLSHLRPEHLTLQSDLTFRVNESFDSAYLPVATPVRVGMTVEVDCNKEGALRLLLSRSTAMAQFAIKWLELNND